MPAQNASLWAYAAIDLGRVVGNGQCTELVDTWAPMVGIVLPQATTDGGQDYIWGTLVTDITGSSSSVANILPGDVLQYKNVQIRYDAGNGVMNVLTVPHHTAVVASVSTALNALCVLEQNVNGKTMDSYGYYQISGMQSGEIHVYRINRN